MVPSTPALAMKEKKTTKDIVPRENRRLTPGQRRRYYQQNIHRERQRSKDYKERNREYVKAYQQQYRAANRDRRKEHQRKYRAANGGRPQLKGLPS